MGWQPRGSPRRCRRTIHHAARRQDLDCDDLGRKADRRRRHRRAARRQPSSTRACGAERDDRSWRISDRRDVAEACARDRRTRRSRIARRPRRAGRRARRPGSSAAARRLSISFRTTRRADVRAARRASTSGYGSRSVVAVTWKPAASSAAARSLRLRRTRSRARPARPTAPRRGDLVAHVEGDEELSAGAQDARQLAQRRHQRRPLQVDERVEGDDPASPPSANGRARRSPSTKVIPGFARRASSTIAGARSSPLASTPRSWRYRATWPGPQPTSHTGPRPAGPPRTRRAARDRAACAASSSYSRRAYSPARRS